MQLEILDSAVEVGDILLAHTPTRLIVLNCWTDWNMNGDVVIQITNNNIISKHYPNASTRRGNYIFRVERNGYARTCVCGVGIPASLSAFRHLCK